MKNLLSISLITATALLLSACNSSDEGENSNANQRTLISGSTTVSQGTVCLDENRNFTCDNDEVKVQTDDKGKYSLEVNASVNDGSQIIVEDGFNLVLQDNNLNRLAFVTQYHASEETHNINTMSTLIANAMNKKGYNLDEAKAYIANLFDLDAEIIDKDPIALLSDENGKYLFLNIQGIESKYVEKLLDNQKSRSLQRAEDSSANSVITEEEAVGFLDGVDLSAFDLDEYIYKLDQYFNDIYYYADNLFSKYVLNTCFLDSSCGENDNVPREALNGVWYLSGDNNTSACVEITPQSKYTRYNFKDTEELSMYYREYANEFSLLEGWKDIGLMKINRNTILPEVETSFDSFSFKYTASETNTTSSLRMYKEKSLDECRILVENHAKPKEGN